MEESKNDTVLSDFNVSKDDKIKYDTQQPKVF